MYKSTCSADDKDHLEVELAQGRSSFELRQDLLFSPIAEAEIDKETTQRHTQERNIDDIKRQEKADKINKRIEFDGYRSEGNKFKDQELNRSINESNDEDSGAIKPIIKSTKNRQQSYQPIDIKGFREKLKHQNTNKSFEHNVRVDSEGHQIVPGGHYKVMF